MPRPTRPLPFILAATDQGSLIVNRNDYRLVDATRGYGVGFQLLNTGAFDPEEVDLALTLIGWLREFRGDGVVALDGGANIGVHTIAWATHMTGWGSVLAVEAQERFFYALAGNICLNNCFNARALLAALADADGTLAMPQPDYSRPASFGSLELRPRSAPEDIGQPLDYRPEAMQPVRSIRLDSLGLPRLDLLKLDIEGMEQAALQGASEVLGRCRPYLLVEHIKADVAELSGFLGRFGYRFWPVGINLLALPEGDPGLARIHPAQPAA
ncbi:MAG: hypothetical protein RLZZ187_2812 [Pseudomonadota bacterium]